MCDTTWRLSRRAQLTCVWHWIGSWKLLDAEKSRFYPKFALRLYQMRNRVRYERNLQQHDINHSLFSHCCVVHSSLFQVESSFKPEMKIDLSTRFPIEMRRSIESRIIIDRCQKPRLYVNLLTDTITSTSKLTQHSKIVQFLFLPVKKLHFGRFLLFFRAKLPSF